MRRFVRYSEAASRELLRAVTIEEHVGYSYAALSEEKRMRKGFFNAGVLLAALLTIPFATNAQPDTFPPLVSLPDGFRPEGVALGYGHSIFAGSLADGSIYRADLRTGEGDVLVPTQVGRVAVGLAFDRRSNQIFVSGGPSGQGFVYDAETGAEVDAYQLSATPNDFINDVIVTRDAAYFTNSFQSSIYRVPLGPGGRLPERSEVEEIVLGGDWFQEPGFNANGIVGTPNGKWLIIVNSASGELFRVHPRTGEALLIDLGGESLSNGDGLVLAGRTLYVVRNRLNLVAVIELSRNLTAGAVVAELTSPEFDVPTTAAGFGDALYVVNARFGTPPTLDTDYDIVRVLK